MPSENFDVDKILQFSLLYTVIPTNLDTCDDQVIHKQEESMILSTRTHRHMNLFWLKLKVNPNLDHGVPSDGKKGM